MQGFKFCTSIDQYNQNFAYPKYKASTNNVMLCINQNTNCTGLYQLVLDKNSYFGQYLFWLSLLCIPCLSFSIVLPPLSSLSIRCLSLFGVGRWLGGVCCICLSLSLCHISLSLILIVCPSLRPALAGDSTGWVVSVSHLSISLTVASPWVLHLSLFFYLASEECQLYPSLFVLHLSLSLSLGESC